MSETKSENRISGFIKKTAGILSEDLITVYAAQASFFVVISVVPFLSLLISIISFFIPADIQGMISEFSLSEEVSEVLGTLLVDLNSTPKVPLLSFSAVITLWSASKGVSAIRTGIQTVYGAVNRKNIVSNRLKSLLTTILFMLLIIATVVLLLFGDYLVSLISIVSIRDLISTWSTPFIFIILCVMLTIVYTSTARRSSKIRHGIILNTPGAMFAALGWILFSYFYSLYIRYFPSASYIYGSLAAVCLIMLWLYFCMIIMLLGAEVNKMFSTWFVKPERKAEDSNENISA